VHQAEALRRLGQLPDLFDMTGESRPPLDDAEDAERRLENVRMWKLALRGRRVPAA